MSNNASEAEQHNQQKRHDVDPMIEINVLSPPNGGNHWFGIVDDGGIPHKIGFPNMAKMSQYRGARVLLRESLHSAEWLRVRFKSQEAKTRVRHVMADYPARFMRDFGVCYMTLPEFDRYSRLLQWLGEEVPEPPHVGHTHIRQSEFDGPHTFRFPDALFEGAGPVVHIRVCEQLWDGTIQWNDVARPMIALRRLPPEQLLPSEEN